MIRLLKANFYRLQKSKLLKIMILVISLLTSYMVYSRYKDFKLSETLVYYDEWLGIFLVFVGIVITIFTGLFLSIEYDDKTINNKVIMGHKRLDIYLANFVTIIVVSLFLELLYMSLISVLSIPLFGFLITPGVDVWVNFFMLQLVILASSAIYTFIGMMVVRGMLINVWCLLIAFGSYFVTLSLFSIIDAPKYIPVATMTNNDTGELETIKELNPRYPSELKRKIANSLTDVIPQAQSIKIVRSKVTNKKVMVVYSLSTMVLFTGMGVILFKKKELK